MVSAFALIAAQHTAPGYCPAKDSIATFSTNSFTERTVSSDGVTKGFQWYRWNWFNGRNPADRITLAADGTVSVSGVSGPNGQLATAAAIPDAPYFVGTAFGGGFCIEAQVAFDPAVLDTSKGFPAFWSMSLEHLAQHGGAQMPGQHQGVEHFIELDFMEVFKRPLPEYLGTVHDWSGIYRTSCPGRTFCDVFRSFENQPGVFPPDTDWRTWHRVGAVWQPASSGGRGSVQYFFDGKPLAPPFTWTAGGEVPPMPLPGAPQTFSILDCHHLVLILGSGATPLRVRSITVYQETAEHNLKN